MKTKRPTTDFSTVREPLIRCVCSRKADGNRALLGTRPLRSGFTSPGTAWNAQCVGHGSTHVVPCGHRVSITPGVWRMLVIDVRMAVGV